MSGRVNEMFSPVCESRHILNVRVDATSYVDATARVLAWAQQSRSCYVCLATVNSIMEAHASGEYQRVMRDADLVTSDGMPLVWLLRWLGIAEASRVYGPDLVPMVLAAAAEQGIRVGFYGGSERALAKLLGTVGCRFPDLQVAYAYAPPFRALTPEEDDRQTRAIADSGTRILFVGLGGAKQDYWMHAHHGRVRAVMLGVGAAFDYLAGTKPQAPRWMRRSGLEWLFRLGAEPRRLWRRYLARNPRFAILALAQLVRTRFHEHRRTA
jgi:N-acetylglucosaminyldiphosphoundecaprenol N-acetyl-beta-D-mannosaminyltransferase